MNGQGEKRRRIGRYVYRHHWGMFATFVALSGTAYAATKLPANSVGTRQLRTGAVTPPKLARSVLRMLGSNGAQGPVGPRGAQGPAGLRGPQGTQGQQGIQGLQGLPGPGASRFDAAIASSASAANDQTTTLLTIDELTLSGRCVSGGGTNGAALMVESSVDANLDGSSNYATDGGAASPDVFGTTLSAGSPTTTSPIFSSTAGGSHKTGQLIFHTSTRSIAVQYEIYVNNNACAFDGVAVPAT